MELDGWKTYGLAVRTASLHLKVWLPAADTPHVEHPLPEASLEAEPADTATVELLPLLDEVDSVELEEEEPDNAVLSDDERLQSADPLKLYVRQIGDGRLLTVQEERELARRKDLGDEQAKRRLIESNLRLVM